jgi:hypothetical protein
VDRVDAKVDELVIFTPSLVLKCYKIAKVQNVWGSGSPAQASLRARNSCPRAANRAHRVRRAAAGRDGCQHAAGFRCRPAGGVQHAAST